jgi:hypothetical protein
MKIAHLLMGYFHRGGERREEKVDKKGSQPLEKSLRTD